MSDITSYSLNIYGSFYSQRTIDTNYDVNESDSTEISDDDDDDSSSSSSSSGSDDVRNALSITFLGSGIGTFQIPEYSSTLSTTCLNCCGHLSISKGIVYPEIRPTNGSIQITPINTDNGYLCISHVKVFFTYKTTFPTLTSVYPRLSPFEGGTKVIINGENFRINMNLFCFFNNEKRSALYLNDKHVLCVVPPLSNEERKSRTGTETTLVSSPLSVVFSDQSDYAKANLSMVLSSKLDFSYYKQPTILRVVPSAMYTKETGSVSIVATDVIDTQILLCKFQSLENASSIKITLATLVDNLVTCEVPSWEYAEKVNLSITLNGQQFNEAVEFEFTLRNPLSAKLFTIVKYFVISAVGCSIVVVIIVGLIMLRKRNRLAKPTISPVTKPESESTLLLASKSGKEIKSSGAITQTENSADLNSPKRMKRAKRGKGRKKKVRRPLMFSGSEVELVRKISEEALPVAYDIYVGKWKGSFVSVKLLKAKAVCEESLGIFESEISLLRCLRSPAIIEYFGNVYDKYSSTYAIITEHMELGQLYSVLHGINGDDDDEDSDIVRIEWPVLLRMLKDVAAAISYLHASGFVLLNMSSKSFIVNKNFQVKFAALSSLRNNNNSNNNNGNSNTGKKRKDPFEKCISLNLWCSPEVLSGEDSKSTLVPSDTYSFGMLMWELVTRQLPFFGAELEDVVDQVIDDGMRPEIPVWCPWQYAELVQRCWDPNPSERPSFPAIVKALSTLGSLGWLGVPKDSAISSSESCSSSASESLHHHSPTINYTLSSSSSSSLLLKSPSSSLQPTASLPSQMDVPQSPPSLSSSLSISSLTKKSPFKKLRKGGGYAQVQDGNGSSASTSSSSFRFSSDEYL